MVPFFLLIPINKKIPIFFWKFHRTLIFCLYLTGCTITCACHAKRHLNLQKCHVRTFDIFFFSLTVLRVTKAYTFSNPPSEIGANIWCFQDFDLEICCASQRNASFHLSFGQLALHAPWASTCWPKALQVPGTGPSAALNPWYTV